jgi:DNA-binding SARP family transcriptional activator
MSQSPFRMELFGAPRVMRRGEEVRLPIKKSLALLAYTAIEGRTTRAKLAALFWGASGAEAARRNLRRELHRLREAGLGDLLVADDETVAPAPGATSDVADFIGALTTDRVAALQLWRGPLMDGFDLAESEDFERWLAQRRDDLARRYAAAVEAEAAAREGASDARGALALHLQLVAHDPLQESHYAGAMRLLYLLGDRSRALELYDRCRTTLQRELGLQPLPETEALAERIRAAERIAPLATQAVAAGLAQLAPPFVGRSEEMARLVEAAGSAVVTLIVGEPGVGKTRLADEFTRERPERLRMAGSELGRAAPLCPVVELFGDALQDPALRARLDPLSPEQLGELARVLPLIGPAATAPPAGAAPAAMRSRLLDAVAAALTLLAGDGVLWLDDLHWLDELTLDLLHQLAHRLARERRAAPRLVLTARTQELAENTSALALVRKLERASLLRRIELAPLSADATAELVRRLSGTASGGVFAERLHRATLGNPFFLLETIRFLFDAGELDIDTHGLWSTRYDDATTDYAELPVPPNVQQAVLERVERLGPAARRVLETAALAGDGFSLDEVQPATALSDWEALDGLERAAGASLIVGAERNYRFGHDLVRVALDRGIGDERRRLIHLRLAESLASQGGRPERVARHFDNAGQPAQAAPWHLAAARAAERVFAWLDALMHTDRALASTVAADARFELHRQRHRYASLLYDQPRMEAEIDAMQQLVDAGLPPPAAQEVLVCKAELDNLRKRHALAAESAQAALAGSDTLPADLDFRARMEFGFACCELGRFDEATDVLNQVLDGTPALSPSQRARALRVLANVERSRLQPERAAARLQEAIEILTRTGEIESRAHAYNLLAFTQHVRGQPAAAIATLELALADARRAQSVAVQKTLLLNLVKLATVAADFGRAEAHLDAVADLLRFAEDPATLALLATRRAELALLQGRLGPALTAARVAIVHYEDNRGGSEDFWPWYLQARLLWHVGANEAAIAVFRTLPESPAAAGRQIGDVVELMVNALQLPANAAAVAAALEALKSSAGAGLEPGEIDYWRAYALQAAGEPQRALALIDGLDPPQFVLHPASIVALRLAVHVAAKTDPASKAAAAQGLLASAPPLEQLELLEALEAERDHARDRAGAQRLRARRHELAQRLAATLDELPLQRSLLARHPID